MRYYLISILIHTLLIAGFFAAVFHEKTINPQIKSIPVTVVSLHASSHEDILENPTPIRDESEKKFSEAKIMKSPEKKSETSTSKNISKPSSKNLNTRKNTEVKKENISETLNSTQNSDESSAISSSQNESLLISTPSGKIGISQNISGLDYQILNSPEPSYPAQARKVRVKEEILIKTRFLVGLDGRVEGVEILSGTDKLGFRNEVQKALKLWRFKPIIYKGENIKLYFYKDFTFQAK